MSELATHPGDGFFGGLAFLWMAVVAYALHRQADEKWPWVWLAWFGLFHGAGLWLGVLTSGPSEPPFFQAARWTLAAGSFAALFEFGRRGIRPLGGRLWSNWVYAPLVGLVALGTLLVSRLDSTAFCAAAGLPAHLAMAACALLAATSLWRRGRRLPAERAFFFRHWQIPAAAALLITVGWVGFHWRAGNAERGTQVVLASAPASADQRAGSLTTVEVADADRDEPAARESLTIRRLRNGLPLLLFNLGIAAFLIAMWALAQRFSR